jgi:hypothetical protein
VAYRGQVPLEGVSTELRVEEDTQASPLDFGVRHTVRFEGRFTEAHRQRLERAVGYCPVGQLFTKGSLQVDDQIVWQPRAGVSLVSDAEAAPGKQPRAVPGVVWGRHLRETMEWVDGKMTQDGQVAAYMSSRDPAHHGNWTQLIGHTSESWVTPPVPLTLGAVAASTVVSVRHLFPAVDGPQPAFRVEISSTGNREIAQPAAAAGTLTPRPAVRLVVVYGEASAALAAAIREAVAHDPLTTRLHQGNALLSEEIIIE